MKEHGVAAMPIMKIEFRFLDPHPQERGTGESMGHPLLRTE